MPESNEKLELNGLNLNNGTTFVMESLTFTPAEPKPQYVTNSDTDGEELVEEPHFNNASFEAQIRLFPGGKKDMDAALVQVRELITKLQECARTEGGSPLKWTPAEATETLTWYAIMGELLEIPVELTGDTAGWLLKQPKPVIKIKLTCRPAGYTEERVVLSASTSTSPLQTVYVSGIKGDLPAEARIILTDKSGSDQRFAEVGQDLVTSEINPSLIITEKVLGFAGTETTKSGSQASKVVKASLPVVPVAVCTTGNLEHTGRYRIKLRAQAAEYGALYRALYRSGDGPWTYGSWAEVPVKEEWAEIDLGEVSFSKAAQGKQVGEIKIEGESVGLIQEAEEGVDPPNTPITNVTSYVDTISLVPCRRYAVARGPVNTNPGDFKGFDPLQDSSGVLGGQIADTGGTWETSGDAKDFTGVEVNGIKYYYRNEVSDTDLTGRYALLSGTGAVSDVVMEMEVNTSGRNNTADLSFLARYTNVNNYFRMIFTPQSNGIDRFRAHVRVGGSVFSGGVDTWKSIGERLPPNTWGNFKIVILGGYYQVYWLGEEIAQGYSNTLASTLTSGKIGIYDQFTEVGSTYQISRRYRNFAAWVPITPTVCENSQSLQISKDGAIREDEAGNYWARVPEYRGANFELDPAGSEGRINRITNKMRRKDIKQEPDTNITSSRSIEVLARERYLAPK